MKKTALFRKVAPSIWASPQDPSVYGYLEIDVTEIKDRSWILPIFVSAVAKTMHHNPSMSTMVRLGRVVPRGDKSISVMVNIPGKNDDLSALHIDATQEWTPSHLKVLISDRAHLIRQEQDPYLGPVLKLVQKLPQSILGFFLSLYATLIYDFNTRLGLKFLPLRPFGSVIVSNVGSLGLSGALLPLVPLARASLMLSVGSAASEPRVVGNSIQIRQIVQIGVTFDHRLFDGSHAGKMLKDFKRFFEITKKNAVAQLTDFEVTP